MRLLVVVHGTADPVLEATSSALIQSACERDHDVRVVEAQSLTLEQDNRVACLGRAAAAGRALAAAQKIWLEPGDVVLLRLEPGGAAGVPDCLEPAVELLAVAADLGVQVFNRPQGLLQAANRLLFTAIPSNLRPRATITRNPAEIRAFLAQHGSLVLRSFEGRKGTPPELCHNAEELERALSESGERFFWVQEFLDGGTEGSLRVVMLEGKLLETDGKVAVYRRRVARSNRYLEVQSDVPHEAAELDKSLRSLALSLGHRLLQHGIFLANVDFVAGKVVKLKVFNPTGLQAARDAFGTDFARSVIIGLEARWRAKQTSQM